MTTQPSLHLISLQLHHFNSNLPFYPSSHCKPHTRNTLTMELRRSCIVMLYTLLVVVNIAEETCASMAFKNVTLQGQHPSPELVAQDLQRYIFFFTMYLIYYVFYFFLCLAFHISLQTLGFVE